jgi:SM-20-related protein
MLETALDAIPTALAERGFSITRDFLPETVVDALAGEAWSWWDAGAFRPAGVGRGTAWHVDPEVRGDALCWLDTVEPTEVQRPFVAVVDALRTAINRTLYLSLHECELQYAVYPPGQRYERHVDQLVGGRARLVTVLLYLNRDWTAADGGCLRIWPDPDATEPAADVLPLWNTFVCFLSDRIPHEVLPPSRLRLSLGGWLRVRPEIPLAGVTPRRV